MDLISHIYIHHITGNTRQYADCPQRKFAPRWWGKGEPIFISATKRKEGDQMPGMIEKVFVDHIDFESESCIFLGGEAYAPIREIRIENAVIRWKRQSRHIPELFDEQPSERDVYNHEIPCIYGRFASNVKIQGNFTVEEDLKDIIRKLEITEGCQGFTVREEMD